MKKNIACMNFNVVSNFLIFAKPTKKKKKEIKRKRKEMRKMRKRRESAARSNP